MGHTAASASRSVHICTHHLAGRALVVVATACEKARSRSLEAAVPRAWNAPGIASRSSVEVVESALCDPLDVPAGMIADAGLRRDTDSDSDSDRRVPGEPTIGGEVDATDDAGRTGRGDVESADEAVALRDDRGPGRKAAEVIESYGTRPLPLASSRASIDGSEGGLSMTEKADDGEGEGGRGGGDETGTTGAGIEGRV